MRLFAVILCLFCADAFAQSDSASDSVWQESLIFDGSANSWQPGRMGIDNDVVGTDLTMTETGVTATIGTGWAMGTNDTTYQQLNGPIDNGQNFSICFWARPDCTAMNANQYGGWPISDRGSSTFFDWQIAYVKNAGWGIDVWQGGGTAAYSEATNIAYNGVWQHVAAVANGDADTLTLYVNGLGYPVAMTGVVNNVNTTPCRIGAHGWSTAYAGLKYHGYLDDLRIYKTALTSNQVVDLYNIGKGLHP